MSAFPAQLHVPDEDDPRVANARERMPFPGVVYGTAVAVVAFGIAIPVALGLNAQTYFWMPNGRILRVRLNVTRTWSGHADLVGVSSYGTGPAFRGKAYPGGNVYVGTSFEYSLSRRWVLALDLTWSRSDATHLVGYDDPLGLPAAPVRASSGRSEAFGFAPAVEYNFSANVGVLLGVRVIPGGHNVTRSVSPAIAINYVH